VSSETCTGLIQIVEWNSFDWFIETVSDCRAFLLLADSSSLTNPFGERLRLELNCIINCNSLSIYLSNALLQIGDVTSLIFFDGALRGVSSRHLFGVDCFEHSFACECCRLVYFLCLISRRVVSHHAHICDRALFFRGSSRPSSVITLQVGAL
jgi:hypothetical protein